MPPTNVRIVDSPATELIDRIFQRSGIPKSTRTILIDAMRDLTDEDLTYLAKGSDPSRIDLVPPPSLAVEDWRNLVQAYAEATIADRKERSDFISQLTIGGMLALFGLPLTFLGGMWLAKHQAKAALPLPTRPVPDQVPTNHSKRRRQKKGR